MSSLLATALVLSSVPTMYQQVAHQYQVPADALYAIGLAESGLTFQKRRVTWPWSLNIDGVSRRYTTRMAAWTALNTALRLGASNVDIGPMQVSWKFHSHRFASTWSALDPKTNLSVGAQILREEWIRDRDLTLAIGHYHSRTPKRARRYRTNVLKILKELRG